ncbi:MAG: hypothetical protein KKA05_08540 [Alphaproteobacteria bacterium]|nr:hypothetical protein [Alphaproteobacteria bacterium]MBU0858869.1 hypothetical protein [Alphaproteobacteria bacterium]
MRVLRYIFVFITIIGVYTTPARAQPTLEDSTCMPEIMTVIEKRALLEAEREIIQNQNLLFKPDSILEYSCFEQHLQQSGRVTGQMFSEAEGFFNISDAFVDQYSLDRAIYSFVFTALIEYLRANFWHRYLGDRADLEGLPPANPDTFTCVAMSYVWNKAKCMNFITPRDIQDGFYTFAEYQQMQDPRNLPVPQLCTTWPDWEATIQDANRMNVALTGNANDDLAEDPLELYNVLFDPDACAPAIPTGLRMPPYPGAGIAEFQEFMCVTPGCYYNGSTCVNG